MLGHIISQLRPGADLSRVTLPTFILDPRSMLERITKCVSSISIARLHELTSIQLHGAPRAPPPHRPSRRPPPTLRCSHKILPQRLAHQTTVRHSDPPPSIPTNKTHSGVKKPLNPVLGETYTAWWDYPDNTKGYYISEQTSHHPPKSSYFFMIPEHHIRIDGTLKPRSKFLGNSAASMMEGIAVLRLLNRNEK